MEVKQGWPHTWCSGSYANWLRISLCVGGYKGILYLENVRGIKKKHPLKYKIQITNYNDENTRICSSTRKSNRHPLRVCFEQQENETIQHKIELFINLLLIGPDRPGTTFVANIARIAERCPENISSAVNVSSCSY